MKSLNVNFQWKHLTNPAVSTNFNNQRIHYEKVIYLYIYI